MDLTNFDQSKIPVGERVFLYEDANWRYYATRCGQQQESKHKESEPLSPAARLDALIAVVKKHDAKLAKAIEEAHL